MSKTDFFDRNLTVFVGQGASSADVKGVCKRLESVTFSVQIVKCVQVEPIRVYDRGDLLHGARLDRFLEYAEWLHGR